MVIQMSVLMDKLYYGSGNCSTDATGVVGIELRYRGAIEITDKTSDNYNIIANDRKIIIFPLGAVEPLGELFEYTGDINIISVIASDPDGNKVNVAIKKVFDYPELIRSNPEDMTEITSENMKAGYQHKSRVSKTILDKKTIINQHSKGGLYLKDGSEYTGAYHIHKESLKSMTGAKHTEHSEDLYTQVNEKLIKTGLIKKTTTTSKRTAATRKITTRTSGGTSGGSGGGY